MLLNKNILAIGIVFLFVVSSVAPMVTGYHVETIKDESDLDKQLDNLRFMCTTPSGFNEQKYNCYKEQLLAGYSSDIINDDLVIKSDQEESKIPVVSPQATMAGGPMDSAWPMQSHDVRHTSRSPYSTADNPYDEKWRFYTSNWVEGGIAIDNDGTIYFGCFDCYLYALYPDGMLKWRYKTDMWILSTPAIAEDGTIYVGSWDDYLYAINPNGTLKWKCVSGDGISSSPAIGEDGTIYYGTLDGKIQAVYSNGTRKWIYKTGGNIYSDPAIGDDGTVYIGSNDKYLYAMNPDGLLKWRFKTGTEVGGSASIAADGTIYAYGTWDNYLYALYPNNGTIKWKCNIKVNSNPSIGSDGTIYIGGDEKLYAVYPNGTRKWTFNMGSERWVAGSCPAISADGTVYIGTNIGDATGGEIIAVNSDGTERWRKRIANKWVDSSPSIAEDGTIYIGVAHTIDSGYLYAFGRKELESNADGPYYGLINQPVQFTGFATGGHTPYDWHWDFGDTHNSDEQNPTHIYTTPANYTVTLTVTDNEQNTATDTTYAWIQTSNEPPNKPTINGPTSGIAGKSYPYTFTATDPEGAIIWYFIDWGDETNTGWFGPYDSGTGVTKSHTWSAEGTYTIKCKAKDPYDAEGPEGTLTVTMPRNKQATYNSLFLRFLERFPILQKILLFYLIK